MERGKPIECQAAVFVGPWHSIYGRLADTDAKAVEHGLVCGNFDCCPPYDLRRPFREGICVFRERLDKQYEFVWWRFFHAVALRLGSEDHKAPVKESVRCVYPLYAVDLDVCQSELYFIGVLSGIADSGVEWIPISYKRNGDPVLCGPIDYTLPPNLSRRTGWKGLSDLYDCIWDISLYYGVLSGCGNEVSIPCGPHLGADYIASRHKYLC